MATTSFRTVTCQLGHDVPVEAVETVELALDALRYDLDVCEVHAEEVRDVVEEFVGAGRRLPARGRRVVATRRRRAPR